MPNVALLVRYDVKPEFRDAFERLIRDHAEKTLQEEEGCLQFDVLIPAGDQQHIHLYELYRDERVYAEHTRGARLVQLRERYKDMLTSRDIVVCSR